MNFDEIKKSWNNQSIQAEKVTEETLLTSKSRLPLDRIRKNTLQDIILQTSAVVGIAFFPQLHAMPEDKWFFFYGIYILFAFVSFYYIIKMALFYRSSSTFEMNSRDSLYEVYFQTRMYVQLYENFCFSLAPFVLFFIPFFTKIPLNKINLLFTKWYFLVFLILSSASVFFICRLWIKRLYGRYLKQIKETLDQFKTVADE